ncbi:MAG: hypothetical protein IJX53_06735 [Clostridia bacterium]|nr:hypothetical protein [Clostridia bacterium]
MVYLLYFGLPAAALVFFVVSLVLYCAACRQNKRAPGSVAPDVLRRRRLMLIVSSLIAGVFAAVVIAFTALLFMAVAFM